MMTFSFSILFACNDTLTTKNVLPGVSFRTRCVRLKFMTCTPKRDDDQSLFLSYGSPPPPGGKNKKFFN